VLALTLFALTVALLDSVNPSTVAPALYLATSKGAARSVAAFMLGVFAVSLTGGLALTLGPGRLLVSAIPRPGPHMTHLIELFVGVAAVLAALVLWLLRERVAKRLARPRKPGGRSPFLLGAGIMAVELPTAFPYFAVIAAVSDSARSIPTQVALIVLYNLVFVLPLATIMVVRALTPERGVRVLEDLHGALHHHASILIPVLLLVVGVALLLVGGIGLAGDR
jgi:cytochrome c biogenesis protein CcdA